MKDEIIECKNEKAKMAKNPVKAIIGISNQILENPEKLKPIILKPGTTNVTI